MRIFIILMVLAAQGCATQYRETERWNLKGGYFERKLGDGLYRVAGKTDIKYREDFGAARKIFEKRSSELCLKYGYKIIDLRQTALSDDPSCSGLIPVGEILIPIEGCRWTVTTVEGEVLCNNSSLSMNQSRELIEEDAKEYLREKME